MTDTNAKPLTVAAEYRKRLESMTREQLIEEAATLDASNEKLTHVVGGKIEKFESEAIDALKAELAKLKKGKLVKIEKDGTIHVLDYEKLEAELAAVTKERNAYRDAFLRADIRYREKGG